MIKTFYSVMVLLIALSHWAIAQRIAPAPVQEKPIVIVGGTVHVGNGTVIENGMIRIENGKIAAVGSAGTFQANEPNVTVIQAQGKEIYPGIIASNTALGLNEIEAARATNDYSEVGEYNPGVRSLIAYNTDSKAIPTVRSNGILIAQVVPQGGTVSGASSIMQLDAWNWEDAQYKADDGIHLNWPSFFKFNFDDNGGSQTLSDDYEKQVMEIRQYFSQAKAYNEQPSAAERNINFEAMKGLYQSKSLFVHCDYIREITNAVQFASDLKLRLVIVGGRDSYMCTDLLKEKNVAVILGDVHQLPGNDDVEIEIPYQTAALLSKAGVTYCLSINGYWQVRNLPFIAGTTVAYGVSKEDAIKSITSAPAKILGIDNRTGTIEVGKDANIIISTGDILDMKTSNIENAFIQGRQINLDNSQKQLYEIYRKKYGLK